MKHLSINQSQTETHVARKTFLEKFLQALKSYSTKVEARSSVFTLELSKCHHSTFFFLLRQPIAPGTGDFEFLRHFPCTGNFEFLRYFPVLETLNFYDIFPVLETLSFCDISTVLETLIFCDIFPVLETLSLNEKIPAPVPGFFPLLETEFERKKFRYWGATGAKKNVEMSKIDQNRRFFIGYPLTENLENR